jgi:hypothetical protein
MVNWAFDHSSRAPASPGDPPARRPPRAAAPVRRAPPASGAPSRARYDLRKWSTRGMRSFFASPRRASRPASSTAAAGGIGPAAPATGGPSRAHDMTDENGQRGAMRSFFASPRRASRPASSTPATGRSAAAAGGIGPAAPATGGPSRAHDMTDENGQRGDDAVILRQPPPRQPTRQLDGGIGPAAPRAHVDD